MVPKTVPIMGFGASLITSIGAVVRFRRDADAAEESLAEVMSRRSLAMDTVEAAQSLKSGSPFSSECEDSRMIGLTPMSVADRSYLPKELTRPTNKSIIFGVLSQPKAVLNVISAAAEDS